MLDGIAAADVVFLGEANHFVHEKAEFRLWWLERLAARRRLMVGEELGWFDAGHVARFLATGDPAAIGAAATFGGRAHLRTDRDDTPTGVLAASHRLYPTELFRVEQTRFYEGLRRLPGKVRFFGFDVDAPGAGYGELRRAVANAGLIGPAGDLERVEGESLAHEVSRLEALAARLEAQGPDGAAGRQLMVDLGALIGSLSYAAEAGPAPDYESLRPAMARREEIMKRNVEWMLDEREDRLVVLLGHNFHLVKDDAAIAPSASVGPGGGLVPSIGHHVANHLGLRVGAVWMLYGSGEDSQPFPDLPRVASYPASSLNGVLASAGRPVLVPAEDAAAACQTSAGGRTRVGIMYNLVVPVDLVRAVDIVHFVPSVTPMRAPLEPAPASA
ncbi:MAG TPA: erythromycin esterase family protein [Acidimicrobiales bacterium]|nr:erythromycin esterase family protein [Acidimicrobiales bacterium]